MSKLWIKIKAFTILESLVAMTILSICTSLFIVLMVTIIRAPSVLNKCEIVMNFEKDFLSEIDHELSDSLYKFTAIDVLGKDVWVIDSGNKKIKWSIWTVSEKK